MASTLLALGLAAVLLVAPGLLLSYAGPRAWDTVQRLAVAPALSLGVVWTCATTYRLLHVPVVPLTVVLGLVAAAAAGAWFRQRGDRDAGPGPAARQADRWDRLGLLVAVLLGVAIWWFGTSGLQEVPPNEDGNQHGLWTARIVATGSVDPSQVLVTDVVAPGASPTGPFYPLDLHVLASVLPAPVGVAFLAAFVVVTSVALPLGMFALARRTFPAARRAPLVIAVVAAVLPQYPVGPSFWGGLPLVAAMALVPSLGDAALGLLGPERPTPAARGAVIGLAAIGLFFTQSSALVTAGLLVLCLAVGSRRQSGVRRELRAAVLPALIAAGVLGVVVLAWSGPIVEQARIAAGATVPPDSDSTGVALTMLAALTGTPTTVLLASALLVIGAVVTSRRAAGAGWWLFAAVVALLALALPLHVPGAGAITSPWYSDFLRTRLNLVYPAAFFIGAGLWWLVRALARRLGPAPARDPRTAAAVPVVISAVLVAVPATLVLAGSATSVAHDNFVGGSGFRTGGSLATDDARASWTWLAAHASGGDRILNQYADGSPWMYAVDRLAPLYPSRPSLPLSGDRGYLFDHAASIATDARAAAIARVLHVRYAYVGSRLFPLHDLATTPHLDVDAMVAGGWRVVQRTATTVVLEIPAGA